MSLEEDTGRKWTYVVNIGGGVTFHYYRDRAPFLWRWWRKVRYGQIWVRNPDYVPRHSYLAKLANGFKA